MVVVFPPRWAILPWNDRWQPRRLATMGGVETPDDLRSRRVMDKLGFSYEREIVWADLPHVLYRLYSPGSR